MLLGTHISGRDPRTRCEDPPSRLQPGRVSLAPTHHQVSPVPGNQCVCMPEAGLLLTWDERGSVKSCRDLSERLTSDTSNTDTDAAPALAEPGGPTRGPGTPRRHLVGVALCPPLLLLTPTALHSGCPGHWGEASAGRAYAPDVQLRSALRPGLPAPGRPRSPRPNSGATQVSYFVNCPSGIFSTFSVDLHPPTLSGILYMLIVWIPFYSAEDVLRQNQFLILTSLK